MPAIVSSAGAPPARIGAGGVLLFRGDASPRSVASVRPASRFRRSQADHDVASSDRRHVLFSVLKDNNGANAVEYALIMALVAVFIISGVILMSTQIGSLFNSMASCLAEPAVCTAEIFGPENSEKSCNVAHDDCGVE